jgi:hypothetical protein
VRRRTRSLTIPAATSALNGGGRPEVIPRGEEVEAQPFGVLCCRGQLPAGRARQVGDSESHSASWAEHKDAANATMIDSDDVLLLRPLDAPSRLDLDTSRRPPPDGSKVRAGAACVTICALAPGQADAFAGFCRREVEPRLRRAGVNVRARFATEHSENNYPALPVRQGEEVFVWLSLFPKTRARDRHLESVGLHALLRGAL